MLSEFEARFADVLGARLPAPFGGRARRRGESAPAGDGPVVRVGVAAVEPLDPDFGSVRPEVLAGSAGRRRIVRLGVRVGIDIEPAGDGGRLQELAGIDAVVYELQAPELRSAAALLAPGDQGFAVEHLLLGSSDLAVDSDLVVSTEGWFWPVGVAGETGRPIERALVREFRLPIRLRFDAAVEAGGADVTLELGFGATGTMEVTSGAASRSAFGSIALRLVDAGGGAGAGTLTGGATGPDGTHVVAVADDSASVTYQPPGVAVTDRLLVAMYTRDADGNERVGVELARFDVVVQP